MEVHSVFFNEKYKTYETALKESDGILIVAKFCRLLREVPSEKKHRTFRIRDLFHGKSTSTQPNGSQVNHKRTSEDGKSNISKKSMNTTRTKSVPSSQFHVESSNVFIEEVAKNIRFVRSVNTSKLIHAYSIDQLLPQFTGDYFFYLSKIISIFSTESRKIARL